MYDRATTEAQGEVGQPFKPLPVNVILLKVPFQGGTSVVILYVACFGVGLCASLPSMCLDDVKLGLGC